MQRVLFVYLSSLCCYREGWMGIRAEIGWVGKLRQKKETILSVVRKLMLGENAEAWSRDWSECDGKVTNVGGRSKWQAWRGYYTEWRHPPPHPSSWTSLSFIFPSFTKFAVNLKDQCDELMYHRAGRDQWFIHLVPHFYTITTCPAASFLSAYISFCFTFPWGVSDFLLTTSALCSGMPLSFLTTFDKINISAHCPWSVSTFTIDVTMSSSVSKVYTMIAPWNYVVEQDRELGRAIGLSEGPNHDVS